MKLELDEIITRCEEIAKDLNKRACTLYESQDYEKSKDCIWRAADYKQLAEQFAEWRGDLKKYKKVMLSKPYNVEIQFDDFCKKCKHCEIDVIETELTTSAPYFEALNIYHIKCKNRKVCRMWLNKKLEMESDKEG